MKRNLIKDEKDRYKENMRNVLYSWEEKSKNLKRKGKSWKAEKKWEEKVRKIEKRRWKKLKIDREWKYRWKKKEK